MYGFLFTFSFWGNSEVLSRISAFMKRNNWDKWPTLYNNRSVSFFPTIEGASLGTMRRYTWTRL